MKKIVIFPPGVKLVVRTEDKAIFEPMTFGDGDIADILADLMSGNVNWYFRQIVPAAKKWWHVLRRWERVEGVSIWVTSRPDDFIVVSPSEAWRIAHAQ